MLPPALFTAFHADFRRTVVFSCHFSAMLIVSMLQHNTGRCPHARLRAAAIFLADIAACCATLAAAPPFFATSCRPIAAV